MFPDMSGLTMSASGPRMGRTGSNTPQLTALESESALPSICFRLAFASFSFRPLRFLPTVTGVGRRDDSADLSEKAISLAYSTWPSLAPFSIGPD